MDLVPLVLLLSTLDAVVTMNITRGCFSPANKSCNDTTLSCGDNQLIDLQIIQLIGTCNQTDDCVKMLNNTKRVYQFRWNKDVIYINKQCSLKHWCAIVSPHGDNRKNKTSGLYAYMKYTYKCLDDRTRGTNAATTTDTTLISSYVTSTNPPSSTSDNNFKTADNSVVTIVAVTIAVTVTVVIVVEVVIVLIVIFIYRKRRIATAVKTDRRIGTNKTADAYDEITNVNGYETVVDPGLKSSLSSDKPIITTVTGPILRVEAVATEPVYRKEAVVIEAGKTSKTNTPVYHILQPDDDEKPPNDRKSDLQPVDTYDHIGVTKPKHQGKTQSDKVVPNNHCTARTSYENIELDDSCTMKNGSRVDNSTYNHLYSDNNSTKPDACLTRHIDGASVTTNLNDDNTYNHLHDTPAHEKSDVSLDTMDDNSYTRPDVINDNSEKNDTYNHLHVI